MGDRRFELCEVNYGDGVFHEVMDNGVPKSQKEVCNLLNELHESNYKLSGIILDIIDFIKENGGTTREDFSKWWNEELMNV